MRVIYEAPAGGASVHGEYLRADYAIDTPIQLGGARPAGFLSGVDPIKHVRARVMASFRKAGLSDPDLQVIVACLTRKHR